MNNSSPRALPPDVSPAPSPPSSPLSGLWKKHSEDTFLALFFFQREPKCFLISWGNFSSGCGGARTTSSDPDSLRPALGRRRISLGLTRRNTSDKNTPSQGAHRCHRFDGRHKPREPHCSERLTEDRCQCFIVALANAHARTHTHTHSSDVHNPLKRTSVCR